RFPRRISTLSRDRAKLPRRLGALEYRFRFNPAEHRRGDRWVWAMASTISDDLRAGALVYHRLPKPGKLEIQPTKPLGNQRDLALAYSPGVAAACEAIVADPGQAAELTARA